MLPKPINRHGTECRVRVANAGQRVQSTVGRLCCAPAVSPASLTKSRSFGTCVLFFGDIDVAFIEKALQMQGLKFRVTPRRRLSSQVLTSRVPLRGWLKYQEVAHR